MTRFPPGAVCVVGLSKAASQNPITRVHQSLIGSFVADPQSGLIHDVQFNTICRITSDFIASQLLGMSLYTDLDEMISRIQNRYFGDSRAGRSPSSCAMPQPSRANARLARV